MQKEAAKSDKGSPRQGYLTGGDRDPGLRSAGDPQKLRTIPADSRGAPETSMLQPPGSELCQRPEPGGPGRSLDGQQLDSARDPEQRRRQAQRALCVLASEPVAVRYSSRGTLVQTFVTVAAVVCSKCEGGPHRSPSDPPVSSAARHSPCAGPRSPARSVPPTQVPAPHHARTSESVPESYHHGLKPAQDLQGRGTESQLPTAPTPSPRPGCPSPGCVPFRRCPEYLSTSGPLHVLQLIPAGLDSTSCLHFSSHRECHSSGRRPCATSSRVLSWPSGQLVVFPSEHLPSL